MLSEYARSVKFIKDRITIVVGDKKVRLPLRKSQAVFELIAGNDKVGAARLVSELTGASEHESVKSIEDLIDRLAS